MHASLNTVMTTKFFKSAKKILPLLLSLGALGLTGCASNPYQAPYTSPGYYDGGAYYGYGDLYASPDYYDYGYWPGYGYPWYPGPWGYFPPTIIVHKPPGTTSPPPSPHPVKPPPAPPPSYRPFIRPAPPKHTHPGTPTQPPV